MTLPITRRCFRKGIVSCVAAALFVPLVFLSLSTIRAEGIFLNDDDFARAKANLDRFEWARKNLETRKQRYGWIARLNEADIKRLIRNQTPYVWMNCPACGQNLYYTHKWIEVDHVRCENCNTDFHYDEKLGTDTRDINGLIRFHNVFKLLSSMEAVGETYRLTGDRAYAEAVANVLRRFADVYPNYKWHDFHKDTGALTSQAGRLHGWNYYDVLYIAESAVALSYIRDAGVLTDADTKTLEENLFKPAMRIATDPVNPLFRTLSTGEFMVDNSKGHVLSAMFLLADTLRDKQYFDQAFESLEFTLEPGPAFFADGAAIEGSGSYWMMWLNGLYRTPYILQRLDQTPRVKRLLKRLEQIYEAPVQCLLPDLSMPPNNDSHVAEKPTRRSLEVLCYAFGRQDVQTYLASLYPKHLWESQLAIFKSRPDMDWNKVGLPPAQNTTLLPGLGWAALRSHAQRKNQVYVLLDWGEFIGSHSHYDRCSLYLYGHGAEMLTDLGYKHSHHIVRKWLTGSLSHNTVMVDAELCDSAQRRRKGMLRFFLDSPTVTVVKADSTNQVTGVYEYSRTLVMMEEGCYPYIVDYFLVDGGKTKDYVLLADATVASASIPMTQPWNPYPDKKITDRLYYDPTGLVQYDFEHEELIWDARTVSTKQAFAVDWKLDDASRTKKTGIPEASEKRSAAVELNVGLRTHFFPVEQVQVGIGKAHGVRRQRVRDENRIIPIFIARAKGLKSHFLAVHEPFAGSPFLKLDEQRSDAHGKQFRFELPDGAVHEWIMQKPNARHSSNIGKLTARADLAFAVLKHGELVVLGLVNGRKASWGPFSLAAEQWGKIDYAILRKGPNGRWELRASEQVRVTTPSKVAVRRID